MLSIGTCKARYPGIHKHHYMCMCGQACAVSVLPISTQLNSPSLRDRATKKETSALHRNKQTERRVARVTKIPKSCSPKQNVDSCGVGGGQLQINVSSEATYRKTDSPQNQKILSAGTASEVVDEAKGERPVERAWIRARNARPIATTRRRASEHDVWLPCTAAQMSPSVAALSQTNKVLI